LARERGRMHAKHETTHHHPFFHQSKTPQIIGMDCPALEKFKLTMPIAPEECCPDLRAFITQGCACSQDVIDLITMSGGTPENLRAAMKMAQSGQCADAAHGGPIIDVCTGSAGCPPA
jgi:hypothetical protein